MFAAVCDFRYLWIHMFHVSSESVFCWEVLLLEANSWEQFDQYFWNDLHFMFLLLVESGREDVVKHHHLLMDVWCNNQFSCNELESSELNQLFIIDYIIGCFEYQEYIMLLFQKFMSLPCFGGQTCNKKKKWRFIFVSFKFFGETQKQMNHLWLFS